MNTIAHDRSRFWVVTCISNPARYDSRYRLYHQFKEEMQAAGVNLFTVELQQGRREFAITRKDDPNALQVRTYDWLWLKENLLNLGIQQVMRRNPKYIAWIDADISFQRKDWVEETMQQLQVFKYVQMFQNAIDLGPSGETLQVHTGFMYSYFTDKKFLGRYGHHSHPGFAHAARAEVFKRMRLLDTPILGAADHHMCMALVGKAQQSYPQQISKGYKEDVLSWQALAERNIEGNVGYVSGSITHHWHGKKRNRFYVERWKILTDNQFDPNVDLTIDGNGLYTLVGNKPKLRDDIRKYFMSRNEDSIDAE